MRQRISTAVVLAVLLTVMAPIATVATHADEPLSQANATLRNASGVIVGTAAFTQTAVGVDIHVQVTDIDPGTHGIHIHTIGSCQPPDFTSAGGHFNPEGSQHGLENKQGPHAGDLPNLQVDADRSGELHYTNRFVTLGAGEHSLFDAGRSALVIHAATDDQMTDPTGNSGARVACGEVQPGTGDSGNYCHTFDETGHTVCDAFLIFWERNGGLAVFGYPLTDAFMEANPDTGQEYLVQYFERQRFELHPENAGTVYEVLLGRLGAEILELQGRDWWTLPMGNPNDEHYFPETGHAIADVFWEYWSTHGLEYGDPGVSFRESLLLFGYPISEATQETNADGDTVLTQWFERARFEYHPENGTVNVILLGRLGAELLAFMEPEPEPEITVVATGFDNPRHLNSGPDGMLYVAEAGSGGDQCVTGEGPEGPGEFCYGPTGAITSITTDGDDMSEEVVSGFPSVAEPTGMFATGVHDVSLAADGTIYAILGEAIEYDDPDDDTEIPGLSSTLVRINADGTWTVVADLGAYEAANNPDQGTVSDETGQPTDEPELHSNPYAVLAHDDGVYVIDAGANDLLRVTDDGTVSTYAVFSPQTGTVEDVPPFIPLPPNLPPGFTFPIQAVPTSIAVGADGAFYVGELTGFPFPVDRARVWRVMDENGDGDALDEGETAVFATGFTNIIDVDVAPDGTLYVLEFARQGLLAAEGSGGDDEEAVTGALVRVNADGNHTEVASTGLILPGGLEINADGDIFVSNYSVFPGVGQEEFPETGQVVQVILANE